MTTNRQITIHLSCLWIVCHCTVGITVSNLRHIQFEYSIILFQYFNSFKNAASIEECQLHVSFRS